MPSPVGADPTTALSTTGESADGSAYVALLRGINVGKAKRIAMADLREIFGDLGFVDVATLLQSGNVVFRTGGHAPETPSAETPSAETRSAETRSAKTRSAKTRSAETSSAGVRATAVRSVAPDAAQIEDAIHERTGVRSTVLVLPAAHFRAIAAADPLREIADDPSKHLLTFLIEPIGPVPLPDPETLAPELLAVSDRAVYQWCALGVLETKVPLSFWKALPVGTARNRRTVDKILAMLDALPT